MVLTYTCIFSNQNYTIVFLRVVVKLKYVVARISNALVSNMHTCSQKKINVKNVFVHMF